MAVKFIICGAAGRMGKALCTTIQQAAGATLVGAIEAPGHAALGQDVGTQSGIGAVGVEITAEYAAVAAADTVTLDFSHPAATLTHVRTAVQQGAAIAIGTTGFDPTQQAELEALAARTRCLIAPNMSIGVAVLDQLARAAAAALGTAFDAEIVEMHHRMKVDAPSGTALALAHSVAAAKGLDFDRNGVFGRQGTVGARSAEEIGVLALRGGGVVGDHTIIFASDTERIELTHRAQSRDCLAQGAVRAGFWLIGQPNGRYAMRDVLGFAAG